MYFFMFGIVKMHKRSFVMMKLSENLKNFRLLRGMSQADVAKLVHRSPNVISNWEKGTNNPDVEIVSQLCEIFNVTPNMMFGVDKCPELEEFLHEKKMLILELDDMVKQRDDLEKRIKAYSEKISRRR